MKNHCLLLTLLFAVHAAFAIEGQSEEIEGQAEAMRRLSPYRSFCPRLARALRENDVDELLSLVEPSFRSVITNDVREFKLRFEGLRQTEIYCCVCWRREMYGRDVNEVIDSNVGKDIEDVMPVYVVSLRCDGPEVPQVDVLYVNTIFRKDGSVKLFGRFLAGIVDADEIARNFELLKNGRVNDESLTSYRDLGLRVSDGELAWRLARKLKDVLSSKDAVATLSSTISMNCDKASVIEGIERLSAYKIKTLIPYYSDAQFVRNGVHARDGDRGAYQFAVYAEECQINQVGWINVVIGKDNSFRITCAVEVGRYYKEKDQTVNSGAGAGESGGSKKPD